MSSLLDPAPDKPTKTNIAQVEAIENSIYLAGRTCLQAGQSQV